MNEIITTIETTPVVISSTISQTIPADQVAGLSQLVATIPTQGSVLVTNYAADTDFVSTPIPLTGMRLLSASLYDTSFGGEELLSDVVVRYDYTFQSFTFRIGYPLTSAKIIYRTEKA